MQGGWGVGWAGGLAGRACQWLQRGCGEASRCGWRAGAHWMWAWGAAAEGACGWVGRLGG